MTTLENYRICAIVPLTPMARREGVKISGARLAELMASNGYATAADLAKALGVAATQVGHWLNERHGLELTSAIKLSRMFGVSIDYLTGMDDEQHFRRRLSVQLRNQGMAPEADALIVLGALETSEDRAIAVKHLMTWIEGRIAEPVPGRVSPYSIRRKTKPVKPPSDE